MYTVNVVVTFEETHFTIDEDVGYVELCLMIMEPPTSETFPGAFFVTAGTRDGTATGTSMKFV